MPGIEGAFVVNGEQNPYYYVPGVTMNLLTLFPVGDMFDQTHTLSLPLTPTPRAAPSSRLVAPLLISPVLRLRLDRKDAVLLAQPSTAAHRGRRETRSQALGEHDFPTGRGHTGARSCQESAESVSRSDSA